MRSGPEVKIGPWDGFKVGGGEYLTGLIHGSCLTIQYTASRCVEPQSRGRKELRCED